MNRGVRMELVTLMMVMILTTLILMMGVMMVVMEMEEMVGIRVMMTMMHCWLKGGP